MCGHPKFARNGGNCAKNYKCSAMYIRDLFLFKYFIVGMFYFVKYFFVLFKIAMAKSAI